jgi:phage tail sheath protein FI
MPVTPTYPGVYIQEIPSGVRAITGVATSVTAFIGFFGRGQMDRAVQIFSYADFQREYGGLDRRSEASYAIQQYFLNGGREAWVVRVASGTPAQSDALISDAVGGTSVLTVQARDDGSWGDHLRVFIDHDTPLSGGFNLTVSEIVTDNGRETVLREEVWRNLSMDDTSGNPRFADRVINDANRGSQMIRVTATDGANRPLANGTFSDSHSSDPTIPANATIDVTIDGDTETTPELELAAGAAALADVAPALEAAIRAAAPANRAFSGATVRVVGDQLHILAGPTTPGTLVTFADGGSTLASALLLLAADGAVSNAQAYRVGTGAVASTAQVDGHAGADGSEPDATALIGNQVGKTGMYALEDVDLFNILCIPRTGVVGTDAANPISELDAFAVMTAAETYCQERRAFYIIDAPQGYTTPAAIRNWLDGDTGAPRDRNAALYYPRTQVPDPLNEYRPLSLGASGAMAGLYARTDAARGVWKAPAGTEASLRNVAELEYELTDGENGSLNPLAINCLRTFPVYGNTVWGARTLDGADAQASEWKYVPVRRLALFLEESLFRGTQWVVFEPNDEPLWGQIRLNVGAFMHNLFRQGAFQGSTPQEAYFVRCDSETTTQTDINNGIVNIVVGFAPLRPAEFVIISIQQIAGNIET